MSLEETKTWTVMGMNCYFTIQHNEFIRTYICMAITYRTMSQTYRLTFIYAVTIMCTYYIVILYCDTMRYYMPLVESAVTTHLFSSLHFTQFQFSRYFILSRHDALTKTASMKCAHKRFSLMLVLCDHTVRPYIICVILVSTEQYIKF